MSDSELAQKLEETKIEDTDEAQFDLSAKKKKKSKSKKINLDELEGDDGEAAAAEDKGKAVDDDGEAAAAEDKGKAVDDDDAVFADLKKKKKSKSKVVSFDEDEETGEGAGEDAETIDISSMKKKKKKSKKSLAAFEAELGNEEAKAESSTSADKASEPWVGTDRDYTYPELLNRFYSIMRDNNPDSIGIKRKYVISPPQIARDGKKTIFANIEDISRKMHRDSNHLMQFLYSELGTSGSVDGSKHLIIKGRFQQKQIENVLRRYITEYVTCKTCKSGDTRLSKENSLNFIKCESCGSSRSVAAIKTGFQVATKDKRRADRLAAGA
ncbi:translation initiation factor eIF-2 beta subunit [Coemansia sp. Benny D115]|nr:translation initiation factor eIF-2 beta subunit [Coemansia sp. Benny D115]